MRLHRHGGDDDGSSVIWLLIRANGYFIQTLLALNVGYGNVTHFLYDLLVLLFILYTFWYTDSIIKKIDT